MRRQPLVVASVVALSGLIALTREETDPVRPDLLALFEKEELVKYLTDEELYE